MLIFFRMCGFFNYHTIFRTTLLHLEAGEADIRPIFKDMARLVKTDLKAQKDKRHVKFDSVVHVRQSDLKKDIRLFQAFTNRDESVLHPRQRIEALRALYFGIPD